MDPTMSSPHPWGLPTGPHAYKVETWVGNTRNGDTPEAKFELLLRHATPYQRGRRISDGDVTDIPGLRSVHHIVDPERMTVINTTEPNHFLHPGNVHRSVVRRGEDIFVVTHGYGTGLFPTMNTLTAQPLWRRVDEAIRDTPTPRATFNERFEPALPASTFEERFNLKPAPLRIQPMRSGSISSPRSQTDLDDLRRSEIEVELRKPRAQNNYWRDPKMQIEYRDILTRQNASKPKLAPLPNDSLRKAQIEEEMRKGRAGAYYRPGSFMPEEYRAILERELGRQGGF